MSLIAKISEYSIEKEGFVLFNFTLTNIETGNIWSFAIRYSELRKFHNEIIKLIKKSNIKTKEIPEFPKKGFMQNSKNEAFLIKRKSDLEFYLNGILKNPEILKLSEVQSFLDKTKFKKEEEEGNNFVRVSKNYSETNSNLSDIYQKTEEENEIFVKNLDKINSNEEIMEEEDKKNENEKKIDGNEKTNKKSPENDKKFEENKEKKSSLFDNINFNEVKKKEECNSQFVIINKLENKTDFPSTDINIKKKNKEIISTQKKNFCPFTYPDFN